MKKAVKIVCGFLIAAALFAPVTLLAQKEEKDAKVKPEKDKKKDVQQIIVTRKGDKGEKVTIEFKGDDITINGKPLAEFKDEDGDISVKLNKFKELNALARVPWGGDFNFNYNDGDEDNDNDNDNDDDNGMSYFGENSNHAMLGVTTEKAEKGVEVEDITKGSGAEKAGLKEGDVIMKIDDKSIEDPDQLSEVIREHKPGDKVTISFLRDKKEQKITAELGKWKGMNGHLKNFKMDMGDMDFNNSMPRVPGNPHIRISPNGQNWSWSSNSGPKLGLSVQDADDGKGVKVLGVDEESNAEKAGIKEDDIITEVDGKAVNGADEIAKVIRESKEKVSVMVKYLRDGKTQSVEVKMPRKLKTADL